MSFIYLLHFVDKLSHAQHYLGSTEKPIERLRQHARGQGANITGVLVEKGIEWTLARLLRVNDGKAVEMEYLLKRRNHGPRLCPICSQQPTHIDGTTDFPTHGITSESLRNE